MQKQTLLLFTFIILIFAGCSSETTVQTETEDEDVREKNTQTNRYEELKSYTVDLLPNDVSEPRENPATHIVLHFSSNAAIAPERPYDAKEVRETFMEYGVSAHYLIGREGQVYQWVPEDRVAYHAGKGDLTEFPQYIDKLNHYSIGIEILAIGTEEEMSPMMSSDIYKMIEPSLIGYTDEQYEAIDQLIDIIIKNNPEMKRDRNHIIGHDEYAPERKTDPGSLFDWSKIGL